MILSVERGAASRKGSASIATIGVVALVSRPVNIIYFEPDDPPL